MTNIFTNIFNKKVHIQKPQITEKSYPAVMRLDNLAMESSGIWTQIEGVHNGLPFRCLVQCADYYDTKTKSTGIILEHKECGIFTTSDTIGSAMLHAAQVLRGCTINWESLFIKSSKCPLKRKELVAAVKAAWQEAFAN